MQEEKKVREEEQPYLLWGCFVNWSVTLEKIEKGKIKPSTE